MTRPSTGYDAAAYWTRRLADDATLEGVGWRGLGAPFNRWLYRQRGRIFDRVSRAYRFDQAPPRVLEIGPGHGFYVERWRRLGVRELLGIDIAVPAVRRLRTRFPRYRFEVGDIGGDLPMDADVYDVVTAFDVLFHLTDDAAWRRAITTIAALLRPGGRALISDLFPHVRPITRPHQVSRTADTYRRALLGAGLVLESRWPVFVLMHPWAAVRSRPVQAVGQAWWSLVERVAGHVPGGGAVLGSLLYGADGLLTRLLRNGPTMELWVVRKR